MSSAHDPSQIPDSPPPSAAQQAAMDFATELALYSRIMGLIGLALPFLLAFARDYAFIAPIATAAIFLVAPLRLASLYSTAYRGKQSFTTSYASGVMMLAHEAVGGALWGMVAILFLMAGPSW